MSNPGLRHQTSPPARLAGDNRMRVAIAGTSGLAYYIAYYIHQETSHQLIWLSRSPKLHLVDQGYQILVVDYDERRSLEYALRGVDVVISTIPGEIQIRIIDAATRIGVRRFIPAEFEGLPSHRPESDPLDRGKFAVEAHLERHRNRIESTIFVCGVLYERFAPGGLSMANIGQSTKITNEGEYMVKLRTMHAEIPYSDTNQQQVSLCLTSLSDLARFITRSLGMERWPARSVIRGDNVTTYELLNAIARARGRSFEQQNVVYHNPQSLREELSRAQAQANVARQRQLRELIATQDSRYHYSQTNFNAIFPDLKPTNFEDWLRQAWSGIQ